MIWGVEDRMREDHISFHFFRVSGFVHREIVISIVL